MRVFLAIFVFMGLNLSPKASAAWGDWKNKIADAAALAKQGCETMVTTATEAAAKTVDSAMEGAAAIHGGFNKFVDSLPVEGVVDGKIRSAQRPNGNGASGWTIRRRLRHRRIFGST